MHKYSCRLCHSEANAKIPPGISSKRDLRAPDGNRTRTDISVHGIFLLLLLLHKPASSVMLSRCSLDYFLTVRWLCVHICLCV